MGGLIDYETPNSSQRRRRKVKPIDFAIVFLGIMAFAFLEDRLDALGWAWWQQVLVASVVIILPLCVRRIFGTNP